MHATTPARQDPSKDQEAAIRTPLRWFARILAAWVALTAVLVLLLRWVPPPTTAFMLAAHVRLWLGGDFHTPVEQRWTDLSRISPYAQLAVIASEDQHFPFHHGFDFNSMHEAFEGDMDGERFRGGSTISQQTAKNLFLWGGRSYVRKGIEAWFTALMELTWPKHRILEVYLNVAQFGPDTYGVQAASRRFFHKDAINLSRSEAAQLAGVLPNPYMLHAGRPSAYLASRREWILRQMRALGDTSYLRNLAPVH